MQGNAIAQTTALPLNTLPDTHQRLTDAPLLQKRALLIGYMPTAEKGTIGRIVEDLALQKQLLQLRYGFSEPEILQLTNEKATIDQVTQAIDRHFAGAEVAILHWSGEYCDLNSQVNNSQISNSQISNSQVNPNENTGFNPGLMAKPALQLKDGKLSLQTLGEQLKTLKIRHLTTVLDGGIGIQTTIGPDFFPGLVVQPHPNSHKSLTQTWTEALWNHEKIALNPAGKNSEFWQLTGDRKNEVAYFIPPLQPLAAGAIQKIETDQTVVWLGGLTPETLTLLGPGSLLQVLHDRRIELLRVTERNGRSAVTVSSSSIAIGDPVWEAKRRIPRKMGLSIALGSALSKIESVDAISAFSDIKAIEVIQPESQKSGVLQNSNSLSAPSYLQIPSYKGADYIFTKLSRNPDSAASSTGSTSERYGLIQPRSINKSNVKSNHEQNINYSLIQDGKDNTQDKRQNHSINSTKILEEDNFIESTLGDSGEVVKVAVRRLLPKLRSLQALKFLRSTIHNPETSNLPTETPSFAATAKLYRVDEKNVAEPLVEDALKDTFSLPVVRVGDRLQYQIQNSGQQALYWLLWQWDSALEGTIVLPPLSSPLGCVVSGDQQPVMSGIARPDWTLQTLGTVNSFLICSQTPFETTYAQLTPNQTIEEQFIHRVKDPLAVVAAVLIDLQGGSLTKPIADDYELDLGQYMTFPFGCQVI
jgi:hypothetical protein